MKKIIFVVVTLLFSVFALARDSATFNANGDLIPPDLMHLTKGLDHEKKGYKKIAIKHFKKAAMYGNEHAKFFNGLLHMQDNNYVDAYAWLKVTDAEKINRVDKIDKLLQAIENSISADDLSVATDKAAKYQHIYNPLSASIHRQNWVNSFTHTGSRISGNNTTSGKKIFVNARIEERQINEMMVAGTYVNQSTFEQSLQDFVYQYNYDLPTSTVKLNEVEYVDEETGQ